MSMIGKVYWDPGRAAHTFDARRLPGYVRVLVQWKGRGPRNVLVEPVREGYVFAVRPGVGPAPSGFGDRLHVAPDGSAWTILGGRYVRPARGLRLPQ